MQWTVCTIVECFLAKLILGKSVYFWSQFIRDAAGRYDHRLFYSLCFLTIFTLWPDECSTKCLCVVIYWSFSSTLNLDQNCFSGHLKNYFRCFSTLRKTCCFSSSLFVGELLNCVIRAASISARIINDT